MQYYLLKDEDGNDLLDTDGLKQVDADGVITFVPADSANRHYSAYLKWKAEDPENNVAQSES